MATIALGDGSSSSGIVTADGNGGFVVTAAMTSSDPGTFAVDVQIQDQGGSTTEVTSTAAVQAAPPTVYYLDPTSGPARGGTALTLFGNYLDGATAVTFGNVAAASFTINPDNTITAIARAESRGVVDVVVTTPVGTSTTAAADQFTFTAATSTALTSSLNPSAAV